MIDNDKNNNEIKKLKKTNITLQISLIFMSVIAIASVIAFGLFFAKYNSLKSEAKFGNRVVTITTKIKDGSHPFYKSYTTTPQEKTLAELMEDHPNDFSLKGSKGSPLGKYVTTIGGITPKKGDYWVATSKSYIEHYPDSKDTTPKQKNPDALKWGASFINLNHDESFLYILDTF